MANRSNQPAVLRRKIARFAALVDDDARHTAGSVSIAVSALEQERARGYREGVAAEREARQAAQLQVADLQDRIARADVELQRAVLAEREECAKVCETEWLTTEQRYHGDELARLIRARGKP